MDNPNAEPIGSVEHKRRGGLIAQLLDPPEPEEKKVDTEVDPPEASVEPDKEPPEGVEEGDTLITVKVDGKDVQLTQEQIAEAYKNGLRQSDYTKKTMEAAELKNSAHAEIAKAQSERAKFIEQTSNNVNLLQAVIQEQQKTDWETLLKDNPVEYLAQRHLLEQRQAALQANIQQGRQAVEQQKAEEAKSYQTYIAKQHQALLDKLPQWKDETKARAERDALKTYLKGEGYEESDVSNISDHKAVVLARKAMLYDQMMSKASAAAKKVATLPGKVERPGTTESNSIDQRGKAFQTLRKSGRVEDAAAVFATLI